MSTRSRSLAATLVALSSLALACGEAPSSQNQNSNAISLGDSCEPWVNESIVVVGDGSQTPIAYQGRCTGTVVAKNMVLTARHCVSDLTTEELTTSPCLASGEGDAKFAFANAVRKPGIYNSLEDAPPIANVRDVVIPGDGNTVCNFDVALLVLDRDVNKTPAPLSRATPAQMNQGLTAAGFGLRDVYGTPSAVCLERETRVIAVAGTGRTITAEDHTRYYQGNREFLANGVTCSGDSGGPLFDTETHVLVGVVSRGFTKTIDPWGCNGQGESPYSDVNRHADILQAIDNQGHK